LECKSLSSAVQYLLLNQKTIKIPQVRRAKSTNPLNPIYSKLTAVQSTKNAYKIDPKDVQKADYLRVVAIFWTIVLIESIANKAIKSLVATFFLFVNEATEKG